MAEERYTPDEQALFDREYEKALRSELSSVREEEIKAAAQRAASLELDQRRESLREQLDTEVAETTTESATDLREEANREAPSKLLVGLILLLLLLFLLAISGRLPGFGRSANRTQNAASNNAGGALPGLLSGPTATPVNLEAKGTNEQINSQTGRGLPNAGGVDALNSVQGFDPNIGEIFRQFYLEHDGLRVFGKSISPVLTVNGRQIQWFERTRLEYWPENRGTPYEIQSGLVGVEYTDGRPFPKQAFFPNRPGLRFFPETSHGVGGQFLEYYDAKGGLDMFGYPISDEIVEVLPENRTYHTVQYFQRGRMEIHPENQGTEDYVQLGLLGRALYFNQKKAEIVSTVAPTPVPLP